MGWCTGQIYIASYCFLHPKMKNKFLTPKYVQPNLKQLLRSNLCFHIGKGTLDDLSMKAVSGL